jgi:hypothetical protein
MYELNHKEKGYLTANPTSLKLRRTSERELARIGLKNRDRERKNVPNTFNLFLIQTV